MTAYKCQMIGVFNKSLGAVGHKLQKARVVFIVFLIIALNNMNYIFKKLYLVN